ncbi:MAG: hypothetical protein ACE5OT_05245 [Candidatus Hadarchaeaceae archaeon]
MAKLKSIDDFLPFILVIICVASARFLGSEVQVLAVFILTLAIFAWRRYDARILVGTALFFLVVCATLLATGSERYSNEVAIWMYYFLAVGILGLFIEYLRERHED